MTPVAIPKLFISYSWSTPAHEQWVLDLANALTENGIHVILDKWDLREGNDSLAFMESMVTDPTVTKVILVCDKIYANKADGRAGGVGTEAQIISPNIYAKKDQSKFVAVVAEKDEKGKPYLPTYYTANMYVDLSESDRYADNFEKLIRWVFDKPLHKRPEIGRPPAFLLADSPTVMGTSTAASRTIDAFKTDKGYRHGALEEYLALFSQQIERFRITDRENEFDDLLIKSIEDFIPARSEFIRVVTTAVQYDRQDESTPTIHRFFESVIPYMFCPAQTSNYREPDFDNYRFIVHEIFLYYLAILLRAEHFNAATNMLSRPFYIAARSENGQEPSSLFTIFRQHTMSLEIRNKRLGLRRLSLRADLLKQRAESSGIAFRDIMQADFVCFLRTEIANDRHHGNWWPETLVYAAHQYGPFEIFARASSKGYLSRLLPLLGIEEITPLATLMEGYRTQKKNPPRWQYDSIDPAIMVGLDKLGSRI